jgi:glycosyltransferase involved in cell wall biosynthesis
MPNNSIAPAINPPKAMQFDPGFVSIVLPTFNRADTVRRSIRSVLDQSHQNLELIVVDDGSTDNTAAVMKDITDPRVRYIRFERNRGQSTVRNAGIAESRANLIAFQDSDDTWLPEKLSRQLPLLEADPGLSGVYCDLQRVKADGRHTLIEAPDLVLGSIYDQRPSIYQTFGVGIQTCLFRKEILVNAGGFREDMKCFEDLELLLRLTRTHRLHRLAEPLVNYFESDDSVSKNVAAQRQARIFLLRRYGLRAVLAHPKNVLREIRRCLLA